MIDETPLQHHIQKYIMGVLMHQKYARFRDMRPKNIDTNLYSYHLKTLIKRQFVVKKDAGYTLGQKGLVYVDRVTVKTLNVRSQPKIITMLVIQNSDGDVLLFKRKRQPYTDLWTLPYGKIHVDDRSVKEAATREASEKLSLDDVTLQHAGDCYIRTISEGEVIMATLAHVFRFETDAIEMNDRLLWARPHKLYQLDLAPAVEQIVTRTFFRDPFYFEEYVDVLEG